MIEQDQAHRPSKAPTTPGSALGTGLMVMGGVVGVLILLWLAVNLVGGQLRAGGFVFGLMLLALLVVPLVGTGWHLRGRATIDSGEAQMFAARRGVLARDRVVRRELARELEQRVTALAEVSSTLPGEQARLAGSAGQRLREVLEDVSRPGYDTASWLEHTAATLDARGVDAIGRYDDLVLEEARRLETIERELGRDPQAPHRLAQGVDLLASHVREREELLGLGRRAPAMSSQELLSTGSMPRHRLRTPLELRLDDAVSFELEDYVVRTLLTYFAGGRSWRTYQVHDGKQERWLEVRAEGAAVAWYAVRSVPEDPAGELVTIEGTSYRAQENGSATVTIESAAGKQDGLFVEYRRYNGPADERLLLERWPDHARALVGRSVSPDELQLWTKPPAAE